MRNWWEVIVMIAAAFLIGTLATGWTMEYRLRVREVTLTERWEQRVALHTLILDEALRLASPNVVERGLAYAQAVRNVRVGAAKPPGPDPSAADRPHASTKVR